MKNNEHKRFYGIQIVSRPTIYRDQSTDKPTGQQDSTSAAIMARVYMYTILYKTMV